MNERVLVTLEDLDQLNYVFKNGWDQVWKHELIIVLSIYLKGRKPQFIIAGGVRNAAVKCVLIFSI